MLLVLYKLIKGMVMRCSIIFYLSISLFLSSALADGGYVSLSDYMETKALIDGDEEEEIDAKPKRREKKPVQSYVRFKEKLAQSKEQREAAKAEKEAQRIAHKAERRAHKAELKEQKAQYKARMAQENEQRRLELAQHQLKRTVQPAKERAITSAKAPEGYKTLNAHMNVKRKDNLLALNDNDENEEYINPAEKQLSKKLLKINKSQAKVKQKVVNKQAKIAEDNARTKLKNHYKRERELEALRDAQMRAIDDARAEAQELHNKFLANRAARVEKIERDRIVEAQKIQEIKQLKNEIERTRLQKSQLERAAQQTADKVSFTENAISTQSAENERRRMTNPYRPLPSHKIKLDDAKDESQNQANANLGRWLYHNNKWIELPNYG